MPKKLKQSDYILKLTNLLHQFRENNPDKYLSAYDTEYKVVKTTPLFSDVDGHKLSMKEKLALLNFDRGVKPRKFPIVFDKARQLLKEYVDAGGDVDKLSTNDKLYKYIQFADFSIGNVSLSIDQRFILLGFPRKGVQISPLQRAKLLLDYYASYGGDVNNLKSGDYIYDFVKNFRYKVDGKQASLEEKFKICGYPRKPKREDPLLKSKRLVEEFVKNGGNVDDLDTKSKIYQYIKSADIRDENNKKLSIEEIFAAIGFERKTKRIRNTEEVLRTEIEDYLNGGGSFHVNRKSLPFYGRLRTFQQLLNRKGNDLTIEQTMRYLGYKQYSDLYYRFIDAHNIDRFCDDAGYIKMNEQVSNYFECCGEVIDLPPSLVVMLLFDRKLKNFMIEVDYISYVVSKLSEYIDKYGSLKNIKKNDPETYAKFRHIKNYLFTGAQRNVSSLETLKVLGFENVENYMTDILRNTDVSQDIISLKEKFNGQPLKRNNINGTTYIKIAINARRLGKSIHDYLENFGLDYTGTSKQDAFFKVKLDKYPYLDEMKEKRDLLMKESGISLENGNCKEEIFEKRVEVCQQVYQEFKDRIYNATDLSKHLGDN